MPAYHAFSNKTPAKAATLVQLVNGRTVKTVVNVADLELSMRHRGAFKSGTVRTVYDHPSLLGLPVFTGWHGPYYAGPGMCQYEQDGWRANRPIVEPTAGEGEV